MRQSKKSKNVHLLIFIFFILSSRVFPQQITVVPNPVYFGRISVGTEGEHYILIYNNSIQTLNITNLKIQGIDESDFHLRLCPGR